MKDVQLRRGFLEDLGEAELLDGALSGVTWRLQGNVGWDGRDNLSVILGGVWRLESEETFGFIVGRDWRAQAQEDLEQRRLGLFGRHRVSAGRDARER